MAQEKRFSVIVPLYKQGFSTLDTFLHHLREQDYKNYEVIFVINSPDDEAKKHMDEMIPQLEAELRDRYTVLDIGYRQELGNGNHCRAFNDGAAIAKGDYLLFLDPDVYLLPGILREYKDAFDRHTDVAFVYGDYDIKSVGRINGRPYDEYELRCANYVSGAYPVRKTSFKGWDPERKGLQDWDMWLSVVDAGGKGYYLDRPCFETDPTVTEGISKYSVDNWKDTFTQVRERHGNPIPRTVVTSLGAPLHATKAAKALGADSRTRETVFHIKPHEYENLYLLGFYPLAFPSHLSLFYEGGDMKKAKVAGKKRIIHWIGTDIWQMQHKLSWTGWKNMELMLNAPEMNFIHLAEHEETQKELAELGIKADVVPLPTEVVHKISPLPREFTVGVYTNPTQDMYYEELMYEIADAMPDIKFKFFGNPNAPKKTEKNKEWVGWVDMEEFLPTISALVRLTVHDGLPLGPVEAMQAGRNVLTSFPLKHALHATYEHGEPVKKDVVAQIRKMKKLKLNTEASEYWSQELSPELYAQRMAKYWAPWT
jgi:glycosyltransferase involved in cell wall biosynthesis